jgi:hypothetical protein
VVRRLFVPSREKSDVGIDDDDLAGADRELPGHHADGMAAARPG